MIADWLLNLPVVLMAIIVFAGTYPVGWIIYFAVTRLAANDRAKAFKGGIARPAAAAITFGSLVGFPKPKSGIRLLDSCPATNVKVTWG